MSAFNRFFVSLLALGWMAALGAVGWLVWETDRALSIDTSSFNLGFDVFANTQAEQILASIIIGALMLPALGLLLFEALGSRRRPRTAFVENDRVRSEQLEHRVEDLQKELDNERSKRAESDRRASLAGTNRGWHLFGR